MAVYSRGEQLIFDPSWERIKVIKRLRDIWSEHLPVSVSCVVPGRPTMNVLSGLIVPLPVEGHRSIYTGLSVRIARMDVENKIRCNVRTTGVAALNALYDLRTTAQEIRRHEPTQAEAHIDEFFNRILQRPLFNRELGKLSLGNIEGQPTVELAPDMAWYILAPELEAQFVNNSANN